MNKQEYIKRIQKNYDQIFVSCSGGKDSVASLIFAQENFDKNKISMIWVDVDYDYPELFPYMIFIAHKADVHLDVLKVPTPFEQLATVFGNLSHRTRWCGPEGKFPSIAHYMSLQPKNLKGISFEGSRWAESRAREGRAYFSDESESFTGYPTFRPVLDFSNQHVCNYCLQHGFSLNPTYLWFDRTGCYLCPDHPLQSWAIFRQIYPNLFKRFLEFLKSAAKNKDWCKYYASHDLSRYTKVTVTQDNFQPPYTAGYVNVAAIEKVTGIKNDTIRDDPTYTFERAIEDSNVSISYKIIQTPQPDRHKELLKAAKEAIDGKHNKKGKGAS